MCTRGIALNWQIPDTKECSDLSFHAIGTFSVTSEVNYLPPERVLRNVLLMLQCKEKEGLKYGVKMGGSFYDIATIRKLLHYHTAKVVKSEVVQEKNWYLKVNRYVEQPIGTDPVNVEVVSELLKLIQDTGRKSNGVVSDMTSDDLKSLVGTRWLESSVLEFISGLINRRSPNTYALFLNGECDCKSIISKIKDSFSDNGPEKIIFSMSVGLEGKHTFISGDANERGMRVGCHFSFGVYFRQSNEFFYGDSLGWPVPSTLWNILDTLLQGLYPRYCEKSMRVYPLHSNMPFKHLCNNYCWEYYPLQYDSHICGVSVIVSKCLVAFDEASFLSLRGTQKPQIPGIGILSTFQYLKTSCA